MCKRSVIYDCIVEKPVTRLYFLKVLESIVKMLCFMYPYLDLLGFFFFYISRYILAIVIHVYFQNVPTELLFVLKLLDRMCLSVVRILTIHLFKQ